MANINITHNKTLWDLIEDATNERVAIEEKVSDRGKFSRPYMKRQVISGFLKFLNYYDEVSLYEMMEEK